MAETFDRKTLGVLFLRRFAAERAAEADRHAREVQAKRVRRKQQVAEAAAQAEPVPDFSVTGPPKRRVANSVDVERWWREAMAATFGVDAQHVPWAVKERTLAKRLLLTYGEEAVQRHLAEFIAGWAELRGVQEGRLPPMPTLALIWAMRQEVWAEELVGAVRNDAERLAKRGKGATMSDKSRLREERKMVGEYNPREKDPSKRKGSGW